MGELLQQWELARARYFGEQHLHLHFPNEVLPASAVPAQKTASLQAFCHADASVLVAALTGRGWVDSKGPRYCPSIEDKIVRFAEKSSHQIFLEPEGRNTPELYVQVGLCWCVLS